MGILNILGDIAGSVIGSIFGDDEDTPSEASTTKAAKRGMLAPPQAPSKTERYARRKAFSPDLSWYRSGTIGRGSSGTPGLKSADPISEANLFWADLTRRMVKQAKTTVK